MGVTWVAENDIWQHQHGHIGRIMGEKLEGSSHCIAFQQNGEVYWVYSHDGRKQICCEIMIRSTTIGSWGKEPMMSYFEVPPRFETRRAAGYSSTFN